MLEIVYVENSEQFLWENNKQFYLMQKTNFMNAVSRFEYIVNMMCKKQILCAILIPLQDSWSF